MLSIALTLVGILIGVIATVIVSRYYYLRSFDKQLTPYIVHSGSVLGINPSVRELLKVYYKGVEINELFELRIMIANDGQRAIRDCITPLHLTIPASTKVLDFEILYKHPEGRIVELFKEELPEGGTRFQLDFPLLNRDEYFLLKILLDNRLEPEELRFEITADDLPPTLEPQYLPLFGQTFEVFMMLDAMITGSLAILLSVLIAYRVFVNRLPPFDQHVWWSYCLQALIGLITLSGFVYGVIRIVNTVFIKPRRFKRRSLPMHLRE